MNRHGVELNFVGAAVMGHEVEKFVEITGVAEKAGRGVTIETLARLVQMQVLGKFDFLALGFGALPEQEGCLRDHWKEKLATYRADSGREFPPLYRIRLKIEAERVGDAESDAAWREYQKQFAGVPGTEETQKPDLDK